MNSNLSFVLLYLVIELNKMIILFDTVAVSISANSQNNKLLI